MTDDPSNVSGTCPPSRLGQLEEENARLKAEKERLERQLELADDALHQTAWQRNAYLDVLKGIAKLASDASGLSVEAEERLRTAEASAEAAKEQGRREEREAIITRIKHASVQAELLANQHSPTVSAMDRGAVRALDWLWRELEIKELDRTGGDDKEGA